MTTCKSYASVATYIVSNTPSRQIILFMSLFVGASITSTLLTLSKSIIKQI